MADIYSKEDALLHDYNKLSQEYKNKAGRYIKNLLRIQRAENDVQKKLRLLNKSVDTEEILDEVNCSFCGKSQNDAFRFIAASYDDESVYICDECARICGEILDEEEKQNKQCSTN